MRALQSKLNKGKALYDRSFLRSAVQHLHIFQISTKGTWMFRLIPMFQEVQKYLRQCISFYALQQVYHQQTHYFRAASSLQENLTHALPWHREHVDPDEQQNVWARERKGRTMTLLQGTISQSSSHPSDTLKGTRTHWGKSHLCATLKEGGHGSHWKKNLKPVLILTCILLSNPLLCFSINSCVHTNTHPHTHLLHIDPSKWL